MIIRRRVNSNYTIVPNAIINDIRLSIEARWLMAYLLSKPDDWTIQAGHIGQVGGISKNTAYKLVRECIEAGYIRRFKQREGTVHYEVRDTPDGGDPPFPKFREQGGELPFPKKREQEQKSHLPDSGVTKNRDLSNSSKEVVITDQYARDARTTPEPTKPSTFVNTEDPAFTILEKLWLRDHPGRRSMPRCSRNGYEGWDFPTTTVQYVRDTGGRIAL